MWISYIIVADLDILKNYLELVRVDGIKDLLSESGNFSMNDSQLFLSLLEVLAESVYIKEDTYHIMSSMPYAVYNDSHFLSYYLLYKALSSYLSSSLLMTDLLQNAYAIYLKEIQYVTLFNINDHSYYYFLS